MAPRFNWRPITGTINLKYAQSNSFSLGIRIWEQLFLVLFSTCPTHHILSESEALLAFPLCPVACTNPKAKCVSWPSVTCCNSAGSISAVVCCWDCFCLTFVWEQCQQQFYCWDCPCTLLPLYRICSAFSASDGLLCSYVWLLPRSTPHRISCAALWLRLWAAYIRWRNVLLRLRTALFDMSFFL